MNPPVPILWALAVWVLASFAFTAAWSVFRGLAKRRRLMPGDDCGCAVCRARWQS